ncbi:LOW QUALITY PROTEIN: hypothetical protein ACHAW6_001424 [Cyclotella cf. meneghiniana]
MLLYLSGHSRPDIAYTVNCFLGYMFDLHLSHKKALKQIGSCIKSIWVTQGSMHTPTLTLPDYMAMKRSPIQLSCTVFLLTVSDCLMVLVSKLQTETALSTMEAEIIALAHCCCE